MKFSVIMVFVFALTACTPQPPLSLEQKLSGKSPAEQKEILRIACLSEAEHFTNPSGKVVRTAHGVKSYQESEQTRRLKTVCREMAGEHSNNTQQ